MKTVNELRNELAKAEAQFNTAEKAWLAARDTNGQLNCENNEYKEMRKVDDLIEVLQEQIRIAERFEVRVGDGVTYHLYSDSTACTVIKRTAKTITIQEDKATLNPNFKPEWVEGGFAGHCTNQEEQTYTYEANPNGKIITARWSEKRGTFIYMDRRVTNGRHTFYDYNF